MKKPNSTLAFMYLVLAGVFGMMTNVLAQEDTWLQKANFPGVSRFQAVSFGMDWKGYIGGGMDGLTSTLYNDFWEYDPVTNVWTQKANIPVLRRGAIGFSIAGKGYLVGGAGAVGFQSNEVWEYNPSTNTWTQKANFPTGIWLGQSFVIDGNAYVGTGYDLIQGMTNRFWKYDPAADTWTSIASLPPSPGWEFLPGRVEVLTFSIGKKGYAGGGYIMCSGSDCTPIWRSDFWEYDPATDQWTQKANAPSQYLPCCGWVSTIINGFAVNNRGYGIDGNLFWQYNPNTDQWTQKANAPFPFITDLFKIGFGGFAINTVDQQFWQYTPPDIPEHSLSWFSPIAGPAGTTVTIHGSDFSPIAAENIVTLNGSPVNVISSTLNSLTITIPVGATSGLIAVELYGVTKTSTQTFTVTNSCAMPGGNVIELDGSIDFVGTGIRTSIWDMAVVTMEAWIYPTRINHTSRQAIFSSDQYTGPNYYDRTVMIEANSSNFGVYTGSDVWQPVQATPDTWQHIAIVFTANNIYFYKDGVEYEYGATPNHGYSPYSLLLGSNPVRGEYFKGKMDEVRIWSSQRLAIEIENNRCFSLSGYEPSLAAYYRLDETGQGANITVTNSAISTGSALNGLTYGTASTPIFTPFTPPVTVAGTAIQFNGVNQSVDLNNWLSYYSYTISMWLKPDANQIDNATIIDNNYDGFYSWTIQQNGSATNQYSFYSNGYYSYFNLTADEWQHLAITFTTGAVHIYVNGVEITNGYSWVFYSGSEFLRLANSSSGGMNWKGEMDEVRIYNTVLSPPQIQSEKCAEIPPATANLVAYYKMNEPDGSAIINDATSNALTGTTINNPVFISSNALCPICIVPSSERAALEALYNATYGDYYWYDKTNWLITDDVSTWYGVTVKDCHVTEINLPSNGLLYGSLPAELGNLTKLKKLNLWNNYLFGELPSQLGNLTELETLNLGYNYGLSGSIPTTIYNLTNLSVLDLTYNSLTGPIPSEMGNLNSLTYLSLAHNQLSGTIPNELGNLSQLNYLDLSQNRLTGSVPASIGLLSNLSTIGLNENLFENIPMFSSSVTTTFNVYDNKLTFEDIEPNIGKVGFSYSPQAALPGGAVTVLEGSPLNIPFSTGGTANLYQWYKDGVLISGATSSNYTSASAILTDAGIYTMKITNTLAPALTLNSNPFIVSVLIPKDTDSDGVDNSIDTDDDNDGIPDCEDLGIENVQSVFKLYGSSNVISNNEIQLTPAWGGVGTATSTEKFDFTKSFVIPIDIYLGTNDGWGADGIALTFHNDPSGFNTIGGGGAGMGASGINNGLAIEFDTWFNPESDNGVGNDHTTMWDTDDPANASYIFNIIMPAHDLGNIEDGNWHRVVISWSITSLTLSYTFDGVQAQSLSGNLPLLYFGGSTSVYFTASAATGAAANDQRLRIDDPCTVPFLLTDTDSDGISNSEDLDSDGDGIVDVIEAEGTDVNGDGQIGSVFSDADGDGLSDLVDLDNGGVALARLNSDLSTSQDYLDIDSDNDGIVDIIETQTTSGYLPPVGSDTDQDGLDDAFDTIVGFGGAGLIPVNTDGTDKSDYIDTDSDNDTFLDRLEAWDTDADRIANTVPSGTDKDLDGLDDSYDVNDDVLISDNSQTPLSFPNLITPLTPERDWRDNSTVCLPPSPPVAPIVSRCGDGFVTIIATGATGTQEYRWYDVASGGTSQSSLANFTTPSLTITTSFYVSIFDIASSCESNRTPVDAIVNTPPSAPGPINNSGCSGTSISISATGGSAGQYRWYSAATGGTHDAAQTNDTYSTPILTLNTSFFVSINNGTCESPRTEVIAAVIPLPAAPGVQPVNPVCPGSNVILTATGGTDGQYRWYDGASLLASVDHTHIVNNLSTLKTFEVAIFDGTCESNKTLVTATVQDCTAPVVASTTATAFIEGLVVINLQELISDPEDNIDPARIIITMQPTSGASAERVDFELRINYAGFPFVGSDEVGLEVCDLTDLCTQQQISIELGGEITVHNGFSPNGDGLNEYFDIHYIDILPETQSNKVFIYNRWGDEVFSVSDYNNDDRVFKGDSNYGNKLPTGTYFYKIVFTNGKKPLTGFLELKY